MDTCTTGHTIHNEDNKNTSKGRKKHLNTEN